MYQTLEGVILREKEYGDTDKLLTILTRNSGRITAKARGARRRSSTLKSACQLFTYSEFTVFEKGGFLNISDAQPRQMFTPLREDLELLSLASYFSQVSEAVSQEDAATPELFSLLLNAFYALCELHRPQALVKAAFEFRTACLMGYAPQLDGCAVCGNPVPDRFNVSQGTLQCVSCRDPSLDGLRLPISPSSLDALRFLAYSDGSRLFSFRLPEGAMKELSDIAETYLATQLERGFSALDFYRALLAPNLESNHGFE